MPQAGCAPCASAHDAHLFRTSALCHHASYVRVTMLTCICVCIYTYASTLSRRWRIHARWKFLISHPTQVGIPKRSHLNHCPCMPRPPALYCSRSTISCWISSCLPKSHDRRTHWNSLETAFVELFLLSHSVSTYDLSIPQSFLHVSSLYFTCPCGQQSARTGRHPLTRGGADRQGPSHTGRR